MLKVDSKTTTTTSMASFWCFYYLLSTYFTLCSSVYIINFEHLIVIWGRGGHTDCISGIFGKFSKPLGLRTFHQVNFFNLTNTFVSVIVFPVNLVIRVSLAVFWKSKVAELPRKDLFPFLMGHGTSHLSDGCLFAQSSL